jgi:hypothetical protein
VEVQLTREGASTSQVVRLEPAEGGWYAGAVYLGETAAYELAVGASPAGEPQLVALNAAMPAEIGGFAIGQRVRIREVHAEVEGERNWAPEMNKYVGCLTRIVGDAGAEPNGLDNVFVDLNYDEADNDWVWRTVNLEPVPDDALQPERCAPYAN